MECAGKAQRDGALVPAERRRCAQPPSGILPTGFLRQDAMMNLCSEGTSENSPAFQRRVRRVGALNPERDGRRINRTAAVSQTSRSGWQLPRYPNCDVLRLGGGDTAAVPSPSLLGFF